MAVEGGGFIFPADAPPRAGVHAPRGNTQETGDSRNFVQRHVDTPDDSRSHSFRNLAAKDRVALHWSERHNPCTASNSRTEAVRATRLLSD